MRRMASVWLPRFRTDRLERQLESGARLQSPLAIVATGKGGKRLVAVNAPAQAAGVRPGLLLTDAMAMEPALMTAMQDGRAEAADLKRLSVWCRRYSPWVAPDKPDGIRLDLAGVAHLWGGEQQLLEDLRRRLQTLGFSARAAIAGTSAAAWGLARCGDDALSIAAEGEGETALSTLSIRALRLDEETVALLERLGLKTVGQLLPLPRETLRVRFGDAILNRLDEALGRRGEAATSLAYEPVYFQKLDFNDPVTALDFVFEAAEWAAERIGAQLREHGKGARRFRLTLFDTQGEASEIAVSTARPTHEASHVLCLFRERIKAFEGRLGEALAFDGLTLFASEAHRLVSHTPALMPDAACAAENDDAIDKLCDRLMARLGENAVRRFHFRESHKPERGSVSVTVLQEAVPQPPALSKLRPLLMLPHAEPITALSELPDYPPRRFTWRRVDHRIVKAQGPERIAPEWWQACDDEALPRDYYMVEDEKGRRFWLYREGLYNAPGPEPRWFIQGLFP